MLKALIVGESGTPPWAGGESTARLCRWFGVQGPAELRNKFMLSNIYPQKDTKVLDESHLASLVDIAMKADIVFLIGKEAQATLYGRVERPFWLREKFVGLPHPSGRNRQLNDPSIESSIVAFIKNVVALFECVPDKPLDWPKGAEDA
jgi:hypothetical protein